MNIQILIDQKNNLSNYVEQSFEKYTQYKKLLEILLRDPDENLMTP